MDSNGSAIVLEDADSELDARMVGKSVNQYYGQTCGTIHRVFVGSKIADSFIDGQRSFSEELKIGFQADARMQVGTEVNPTQSRRFLTAQQDAAERGGQAILSGEPGGGVNGEGTFLDCTDVNSL